MILEDYQRNMIRCTRCSYCKWIPHPVMSDRRFMGVCPSIEKYHFHGWSGGGKQIAALSLLKGRTEMSESFADMVYQCQMCGGCDVSCKVERDLELHEVLQCLRFRCVETGQLIDAHTEVIESLKKEDNTMLELKSERGDWAEGLGVKNLSTDKAEVLFHAGCRYSFDKDLRSTVRAGLELLINAGVDVGIMGREEVCCGGRSYEMGYASEFMKYGQSQSDLWKAKGIKTIVTPCAECFQAFSVLYDKEKIASNVEILHITTLIDRLIGEEKITLRKPVPMTVAYHDPCHLGRLSEPWEHWEGKEVKLVGQSITFDPPKIKRIGKGSYDIPRKILSSIPGLKIVEMPRKREYAWCCGSGGGVKQAFPDFAQETAAKRLKEAQAVGAEAIVSACPWCKHNFQDAVVESGKDMKVYDIIDLVDQAM
jgi:Fe-S oxidoreductase